MKRDALAGSCASLLLAVPIKKASGGPIEWLQLIAAVDHRGQVVLDEAGFFARRETGEHQDGLADACLADGNAFLSAGDSEPVGAGFFEGLGNFRTPMA